MNGRARPNAPRSGQSELVPLATGMLGAAHIGTSGGVGWHSHRELQWIGAGPGLLLVETEEAQWVALPGQALSIGSDVSHALSWYGTSAVPSVYLDAGALDLASGPCRRSTVSTLMYAAVETFIAEVRRGADRVNARARALSDIIMDELSRGDLSPVSLPMPSSRTLRELCLRLRAVPADAGGLDACADAVGMSRRTFTRRFQGETGWTFNDWVRRMRALHALKQRFEGSAPKQICAACGYKSLNYMHAEVKRSLDVSLSGITEFHLRP